MRGYRTQIAPPHKGERCYEAHVLANQAIPIDASQFLIVLRIARYKLSQPFVGHVKVGGCGERVEKH